MARNITRVNGFIRAVADQTHPLQTKLSIILTDFEPNSNRQGIPRSEAENIIKTALHTPLKINFDGVDYYGHKGAVPIGPITNVYYAEDNGRDIIAGDAIIWNDIYEDIADHLKVAFAEGIGTSWEIYFKDSEKDDNGVEWLEGCVFAGTCVVETPAYGPQRTRVLAIAEKLNERADLLENLDMAKELETDRDTVTENNTAADTQNVQASTADDVTTLRTDISTVMDVLGNIYSGLYNMLDETYELEANLVTDDMPGMAEQLNKLLASISKRFDSLKEKASEAEAAQAELTTLKDAIAQAETEAAKAEKLSSRKVALAEIGINISDKEEFYMSMDDTMFTNYVDDLKAVKGNKATSETKKPVLPDPMPAATTTVTIKELAAILRGEK